MMPVCIYCLKEKAPGEFSKEHVLTRAFCGRGENWTLLQTVCGVCNGILSKFESHWAGSAVEAMMRNFSGPRGRSSGGDARAQAMEVDELYLVQGDDPLVYEAGFAFPGDFYFRPQIVESGTGVVMVAANAEEGAALEKAVTESVGSGRFVLTEPTGSGLGWYKTTTIVLDAATRKHVVESSVEASAPEGIWLRALARGATFNDRDGTVRAITRRLALDDRGRLYLRAADAEDAANFFDRLSVAPQLLPQRRYSADEQAVHVPVQIRLPLVYRCVLKTGLNLVAYSCGAETARDKAFDELRGEILDVGADAEVMHRCGFLGLRSRWTTWLWPDDFPPSRDEGEHRMMLDAHNGRLRFRLRFYGYLGYEGDLGPLPAGMTRDFVLRVAIDHGRGGMRVKAAW
ncbi:HNH endonuclease [Hyphomicrobium sp. MC8b]|uniref:HNH endonuclease n=1 Tax=Hyphomicrobium sp. MC8b TaxID=300273 RepID=UPI00391B0148